ncbi:ABC transporter permease [Demequina lutea]|uniref:Ribose/xylose/arabinose/galactoside ABC-type transport system permease subunit n=1 Tax=Demequina lutea TaxID=431489 RepID=A0A7Y9ZCJ9_9MICO|nr:ABC transporter permease [Demequina lutea]NYI42904.1 ribose/xylose/arabinose/galactoside ABC-type transport system permease subunit [Demequina lutea]
MTSGLRWVSRHALLLIFLVVVAALSMASATFRSVPNLVNIVEQQSIIGIVACGMLLMILLGGFDLSVGAVGAATSVIAAWAMSTSGIVPGVFAALGLGAVIGLCNGLLIAKVGINPFVATLGMQSLVTGLLFVGTSAKPVYGVPDEFTVVGLGRLGPVPVAAIVYGVVVMATWAMLHFTTLGHRIYAVGGSAEASRFAGIRVDRVTITTYTLGAIGAAIGGLVLLGQTSIGQPSGAQTWPLAAIAAVAIAGVPLTGGSGGIGNVVIGTLLLGVVSNALNLFGISPYWQPAFTGAVIIVAVGIDMAQRRRRTS